MSEPIALSERPLNLADVLEGMADTIGDRPAVQTMDRVISFAELDERATRFANHVISLGLQPGDHVAIHAMNCVEWVEAFYGCFKARVVPININFRYRLDELSYLYDNSDAVASVVAPEYVDLVKQAAPDLKHLIVLGEPYEAALAAASTQRPRNGRSGDDRYVIYTGGTTGYPKGVVWRLEDLMRSALNGARYGAPMNSLEQLVNEAQTNGPMTLLACGPMMHGGSQWLMCSGHIAGYKVSLYTGKHFDPEQIMDLVEKAGVTSLTVLGDAMGRPIADCLLANPDRWDLSSLMAVSNGAAPLSIQVRDEIRQALPGRFILDTYGASESGAAGSTLDDGTQEKQAKFGVTDDVQVFDPEMKPCPVGVEGMLARSGAIPLGYYNDPEKTEKTFRVVDGVRWVIPGDFARREDDGSVVVLGRGSGCINTGGEKVFPEEVESLLIKHPDIFDAAVVGTPHERWGQQVVALVQLREGAALEAADLRTWAKERISDYKVPKEILFVPVVPRTAVSKVDYRAVATKAKELLES